MTAIIAIICILAIAFATWATRESGKQEGIVQERNRLAHLAYDDPIMFERWALHVKAQYLEKHVETVKNGVKNAGSQYGVASR